MKNQNSIANKLILKLNIFLSLIFVIIVLVTYFIAKNEINKVFDAELKKSSIILFELSKNFNHNNQTENLEKILHQKFYNRYDYEIIVQIWHNKNLLYNSDSNFVFPYPNKDGFSNVNFFDKYWREFAFSNDSNQFKIVIYENYEIRRNLILEITTTVFFVIFLSSFLIIGSIIKIVKNELQPIHNFSQKLKSFSLIEFQELSTKSYPSEVQPLILSFNELMLKLQKTLQNEKNFTNYAAHELKTPLTAIRLQAEILQNNFLNNKPLNFNQLISGVDRANHLINQILILSRIEGEIDKNNFKNYDLKPIVEEIILELDKTIKNKIAIEVNFFPKNSLIILKIHKVFFKILLKNLIDNALKYSIENHIIELNFYSLKNNLRIEIINSSEDISNEDQNKIFNKFYRANRSPKTKNIEGCGLGLNIIKNITEIHKGKICFLNKSGKTKVIIDFFKN